MALIYPRPMPLVGASSISFEPSVVDYMSPETGGRIGAVAAGFPLWRMRIALANMDVEHSDIWRAFIASMRGSRRQFLATDLTRPRPRFHMDGVPFGQSSTSSWSQTIDSNGDAALTLNNLSPGAVLLTGDYIGFKWDTSGAAAGTYGRRALVRTVSASVVGVNQSVTVIVEPPVLSLVPSTALAHVDQPACLMRIITGSTQLGEQVVDGYTASGGTIEAVQDLLP